METAKPEVRSPEDKELAAELVERARDEGVDLVGPGGLLTGLTKNVLEAGLEAEMSEHLGYDEHDPAGRERGSNSRNGTRAKTVLTDVGPVHIEVPRDRDGTFEPQIVKKRQRRLSGVDEMVISLTAKGLTTGEVSAHMAEVYGADVSKDTISRITDKILAEMSDWQNRPLDRVYPVVFIDAMVVKIRDGQVTNRPVYTAIGVTVDGERDILGLWVGNGGEGAKFWLQVLAETQEPRGRRRLCRRVRRFERAPRGDREHVATGVGPDVCVASVSATRSGSLPRQTGTRWHETYGPSTRRYRNTMPRNGSSSSLRSGATSTPRSSGCGRTPGSSSSRSWTTQPRSARSSTPPTPSSRSTQGCAERPEPEGISPPSRPP